MSANEDTPVDMDDLEPVTGYDPATGEADGHIQGRILGAYNELLERGEKEKAAELRQANGYEQKALWKETKDFDPKHNSANNTKRIRVKQTYDGLLEIAEENDGEDNDLAENAREAAEELREYQTLGRQCKAAVELTDEFGIKVV